MIKFEILDSNIYAKRLPHVNEAFTIGIGGKRVYMRINDEAGENATRWDKAQFFFSLDFNNGEIIAIQRDSPDIILLEPVGEFQFKIKTDETL